ILHPHSFYQYLHNSYLFFTSVSYFFSFFFFNDTATTEIYTLSLHDALPIFELVDIYGRARSFDRSFQCRKTLRNGREMGAKDVRSEEHTSELQSRGHLVCRLLLEKKKKKNN